MPHDLPSLGLRKLPCIWVMVADAHSAHVYGKQGDSMAQLGEVVPDGNTREEKSFAGKVATWLDTEASRNSFDRLVLVAAPHMLGELRKTISRPVYTRIMAEIDKDLTKMNGAALQTELKKILWF